MSIFCAKPKKSGPADDFLAFFHLRPPDEKHCAPSPALSRALAKDNAPQRWFAIFSRHLPAHRNRTIEFDMLLLLIRLYFFVFSALLFVSPGFDFAGKIMLGEQPKYAH
jgi:hypothetical protein